MHKIKLAPVVGSPFESSWSTIITSTNQRIICTLAIKGSSAKNAGLELCELISNQSQTSAQAIHNLLLDLLKKARELEVVPQLSLVAFDEKTTKTEKPAVILAAYQGQILLKRARKIGCVIQFNNEPSLIEGSIQKEDELILATSQTEQLEQSIRQLFKNNLSPDAFASNLNQKVQMLIDSSLFSVVIIKIEELDQKSLSPSVTLTPLEENNKNQIEIKPEVKNEAESIIEKEFESIKDYPDDSKMELELKQKKDTIEISPQEDEFFSPPQEAQSNLIESEPIPQTENDKDIKIKIGIDPIVKLMKRIGSSIFKFTKKKLLFWYGKYKEKQQIKTINSKTKNNQYLIELVSNDNSTIQTETSTPKITYATRWAKLSKSLFSLFRRIWLPELVLSKDIFLGKKDSKITKKMIIMIIGLIAIIFAIVIGINLIKHQKAQAQEALKPAAELLNQAKKQTDENILEARDQTAQAIKLAIAAQKELNNNRFIKSEFGRFIENANEYYTQIDGQIEVSGLEVFFDIREIIPNFLTTLVSSSTQSLFFLDQEQKQLVLIDRVNKQANRTTIEDEINVKDFSASNERLFFLNNGIFSLDFNQINDTNESEAINTSSFGGLKKIKDEGDSNRDGIFIEFYENYLYVFNPEKRNIFRYIVRQDSLSDPIGWLINKQGIEFSNITSFAVDGFIWLTTGEGMIFKLERGQPIEFEVSGLEDPLGKSIIIATNKQAEYLYLLEPAKNRLVVLSKSGEFIRQISSPTFASTTQLLVHEEDKKAYVVSGSLVYLVEL